ncbi:MAG: hemerythrin domain-containing protein [Bacteriovorax sp.]|nr:hemerythrin domain-containing protein [Bacteriovorax sp.]
MQNIGEEIATDNSFNIVNILLIDHSYLKECISVLINDHAEIHEKLFYSRTFLDTLKKHSMAEEKTVYDSLVDMDEFRKNIIEAEVEHDMISRKYRKLIPIIGQMKKLDDITSIEIKVLAKLVKQHIEEEEQELFPKMRNNLDSAILNEIGFQFMIMRRFTPQDLKNYPDLQKEIYAPTLDMNPASSKRNVYHWSASFVRKVNGYIGSIVGQTGHIKN